MTKLKEEKSYVVSRHFSNVGSVKQPRNVKMVDKRMKKDFRKSKAAAGKGGKRGGGKKGGKGGKGGRKGGKK